MVLNSEDIQKGLFGPNKTPLRVGLDGLVWDANDGKYNLQDLNKDLDGFDNPWD